MNGLLVRVCIDSTSGKWNAPVDIHTGDFVYVPIPEEPTAIYRKELQRPYCKDEPLNVSLMEFGIELPSHLQSELMHLDPDFEHLTYGDQGQRAKRIMRFWDEDKDLFLVFYGGLKSIHESDKQLVYAIVGFYEVDKIMRATDVSKANWRRNAHTRTEPGDSDIVIFAKPCISGRLRRCITIEAEFRNHAYRVRPDALEEWGGLDIKDGFIQRSAYLPSFKNPVKFLKWFNKHNIPLVQRNN